VGGLTGGFIAVVVIVVVLGNVFLRNRWKPSGSRTATVRCRHGHEFTASWTVTSTPPRLPPVMRCPVCYHWSQVTVVRR
jgi:hypothetical protein